jgi:hypothetical protein
MGRCRLGQTDPSAHVRFEVSARLDVTPLPQQVTELVIGFVHHKGIRWRQENPSQLFFIDMARWWTIPEFRMAQLAAGMTDPSAGRQTPQRKRQSDNCQSGGRLGEQPRTCQGCDGDHAGEV